MLRRSHFSACVTFLALVAGSGVAHAQPTFSLQATPNVLGPGSSAKLVYTISNVDSTPASGMGFTHTFPPGVLLSSAALAESSCTEAVLEAPGGGDTLIVTGGRLGAASTCTVSLMIAGNAVGTHTLTTGALTSSAGGSGTATTDISVVTDRPGFTMTSSPNPLRFGGTSTLTYVLDNSAGAADADYTTFTHRLPSGLEFASPANLASTCPVYSPFPLPPGVTPVMSITGSELTIRPWGSVSYRVPAGQSCSFVVDVTPRGTSKLELVTGNLSHGNFPLLVSGVATTTLEVTPRERMHLVASFRGDPVSPGSNVDIDFSIYNFDRTHDASGILFTDDLDVALSGLAAVGLPLIDPCGAGSSLVGAGQLTFSRGFVPAGGSCHFTATVQVPGAAPDSIVTHSTSILASVLDGAPVITSATTDSFRIWRGPRVDMTFTPSSIGVGESTELTITIDNAAPAAVTDLNFTGGLEKFIAGVASLAMPANGFCGPSSMALRLASGLAGEGAELSVLGVEIAASSRCIFKITLLPPGLTPAGTYEFATRQGSASVGGSNFVLKSASAQLTVHGAPRVNRTFVPSAAPSGGSVTIVYEIELGAEEPVGATDIAFDDDLDGAVVGWVATLTPSGEPCGLGSAMTGSGVLSFAGGTLLPGEFCTFAVETQLPDPSPIGHITSTTGPVTAMVGTVPTTLFDGVSSDLLITGLLMTETLTPSFVAPGGSSTFEIQLRNQDLTRDATAVLFSIDVPAFMPNATITNAAGNNDVCGSGSVLQVFGAGLLFLTDATVPAGTSCTLSMDLGIPVTAAAGIYTFDPTVKAATIDGANVEYPVVLNRLTVADPLLMTKQFTPDRALAGSTVTLTYSIGNSSPADDATALSFTDDLDAAQAGMLAAGLPMFDVCGSGSSIDGTNFLTLSDATVSAASGCSFDVQVQLPMGIPVNTTILSTSSPLTGTVGALAASAAGASAQLDVDFLGLADLAHSFVDPVVSPDTTTVSYTLTNVSGGTTLEVVRFSHDLDAILPGMVATDLPKTGVCGDGSTLSGTDSIDLAQGTLATGESCSFEVAISIPEDAIAQDYQSSTGYVTAEGANVAPPSADTITVLAPPPVFRASFNPSSIAAARPSTLEFEIDNSLGTGSVGTLSMNDALPPSLTIAAAPNVTTSCTNVVTVAEPGAEVFAFANGTVAAGEICTVAFDISSTTQATHSYAPAPLISTSGQSIAPDATLTVGPPLDSDGDGVDDLQDNTPNDPRKCRDIDGDTCDDCAVTGADGSGGDVNNDGQDDNNDGTCNAGQTSTCSLGGCECVSDADCLAPDECHAAGTCDLDTGLCANLPKPNGTNCDDEDPCTLGESCQEGLCGAATATVRCDPQDECHASGICDTETGACSNPSLTDGTPCSLGACAGGQCIRVLVTVDTDDGGPRSGGDAMTGGSSTTVGQASGCGCASDRPPSASGVLYWGLICLVVYVRRRRL